MGHNKNAATEDEVAVLHRLITRCHSIKAQSIIDEATALIEVAKALNKGESESTASVANELSKLINSRDFSAMQRWVEYNQVGCVPADMQEESELSKKLAKIKEMQEGKVLKFEDIKRAQAEG